MVAIDFSIEVSGCPTTCLHCWARGHPYQPMPIADIAWVLENVKRFCVQENIVFTAYPMHEVFHHPQAVEVLKLFKNYASDTSFELITTDGVSIVQRDDWQFLLETAQACGTKTLWFAIHGKDDVHDKIVNYPGAYQSIGTVVERAHSMGFRCGSNILISRACLPEFHSFMSSLQAMGLDELSFEIAVYNAHKRGRYYDEIYRPTLDELLPYADEIQKQTVWWKKEWGSLPERTEAAWYEKVLSDNIDSKEWTFPPRNAVGVVVRPDLSVYGGKAGIYGAYYGNLRSDTIKIVLQRAMADGETTDDGPIYFSVPKIPLPVEAARQGGNPNSQKVHLWAGDIYIKWLDMALKAYRRY